MIYEIRYKTKKGGSGMISTNDPVKAENKWKSLFKQKMPATFIIDGIETGKIWIDATQEKKCNFYLDNIGQ